MKRGIGVLVALMLVSGLASAHHNMSAAFDLNQRFKATGPLVKIDWRNPHTEFSVEVTSDQGQVQTWRFEGPSPSAFRNWNLVKADFQNAQGKTVIVEASRARDGSPTGLLRAITLPEGKVVTLCPAYC